MYLRYLFHIPICHQYMVVHFVTSMSGSANSTEDWTFRFALGHWKNKLKNITLMSSRHWN